MHHQCRLYSSVLNREKHKMLQNDPIQVGTFLRFQGSSVDSPLMPIAPDLVQSSFLTLTPIAHALHHLSLYKMLEPTIDIFELNRNCNFVMSCLLLNIIFQCVD